ncbi:MAG: ATP-dependent zinc metalloprotease FtsH [Clostridiales bacterium]|jgi:cell division protease FtsH|nr:ATP-dependent zinc metalloprotease FtsH [Clostridiales bacterium]
MNDKNKNNMGPKMPPNILYYLAVAILVTMLINSLLSFMNSSGTSKEIKYNEFIQMVQEGKIDTVEIQSDRLIGYPKAAEPTEPAPTQDPLASMFDQSKAAAADPKLDKFYTGYIYDEKLLETLNASGVAYSTPVNDRNPIVDLFLTWILPILLIYGASMILLNSLSKRMGGGKGGFMSFGQSNAKVYVEKKTGITFDDVAGQEEAKESLMEIVDFLHNPEKYMDIGAKQPKGALLVGPPGTGKTLLAKAVAGEANVAFFSLSGSDFVEMFVGVGASRVRDLFKQANQMAPCIIFIDEIDAIGKSRDGQIGGNDEREQTLNQLLSEMDGFDSSKGVVILAATNRPEILDRALLRPGRFDRRIIVERPDLKGREDILKVHVKKVKMSTKVDLKKIALATSGAAGADLANIVNEAALRAVRMSRMEVSQEDMMEAVEVIVAGKEKKDRIMTEKEKRIVAFHEVGHALASARQKNTQPVQKITIVPRTMGALGYVMQMPEEEHYLMTKDEMLDEITVNMAGRAAEEIVFSLQTTGAANDISNATKMARNMVALYGMSDKFGMMALSSIENQYLDGRQVSQVSSVTEADIDKAVNEIIDGCYKKAKGILEANRTELAEIAEFLIQKETITGEEFMEILAKYPNEAKPLF